MKGNSFTDMEIGKLITTYVIYILNFLISNNIIKNRNYLYMKDNTMAEFDSKDFGERLKNYRIQKGLSQENIAESLNKSKTTVSRYESGEILPDKCSYCGYEYESVPNCMDMVPDRDDPPIQSSQSRFAKFTTEELEEELRRRKG